MGSFCPLLFTYFLAHSSLFLCVDPCTVISRICQRFGRFQTVDGKVKMKIVSNDDAIKFCPVLKGR